MEITFYKIPKYNYEISICGKVRRIGSKKILTHDKNNMGYPRVRIFVNKKVKRLLIHRTIAEVFLPNPNNKPIVNHKDLNKNNFSLDNLEWVTQSENIFHYYNNI